MSQHDHTTHDERCRQPLFDRDDRMPSLNAYVEWGRGDASAYAIGYRALAERAGKSIIANGRCHDSEVYPLAFLWRQFLELQLKLLVRIAHGMDAPGISKNESDKLLEKHELPPPLGQGARRLPPSISF